MTVVGRAVYRVLGGWSDSAQTQVGHGRRLLVKHVVLAVDTEFHGLLPFRLLRATCSVVIITLDDDVVSTVF